MEAKELRLGNLVMGCRGVAKKITEFDLANWDIVKGGLEPLRTTEEWLLKFGFEIEVDNQYIIVLGYDFGEFRIQNLSKEGEEDYFFVCDGIIQNIKYVHELQNLYFALTNEEL